MTREEKEELRIQKQKERQERKQRKMQEKSIKREFRSRSRHSLLTKFIALVVILSFLLPAMIWIIDLF